MDLKSTNGGIVVADDLDYDGELQIIAVADDGPDYIGFEEVLQLKALLDHIVERHTEGSEPTRPATYLHVHAIGDLRPLRPTLEDVLADAHRLGRAGVLIDVTVMARILKELP